MVRAVLNYQSPSQAPTPWVRIVKTSAAMVLAAITTLAQALPTSIGHGHSRVNISGEYTYGWLGTYLRVTHRLYLAAPATTAREIFWLPLIWNLLAVLAVWVICIVYARRAWRR